MKRTVLCALLLAAAAAAAIDWREVASVRVPEGEAASVAVDGETVWKRLPYDAEIEYLESTGTQWIDTGLDYFPDFEIGCKMRENAGNITLGNSQQWTFSRNSAANPVWKLVANGTTLASSFFVESYVDASYRNGTFTVNGTVVGTKQNTFAAGDSLLLLTRPQNLPTAYPCLLYYLKCYDQNGTFVRDYIPVRLGTVGYLYDRVSGQLFGNMGTGAFVLGPDKE